MALNRIRDTKVSICGSLIIPYIENYFDAIIGDSKFNRLASAVILLSRVSLNSTNKYIRAILMNMKLKIFVSAIPNMVYVH